MYLFIQIYRVREKQHKLKVCKIEKDTYANKFTTFKLIKIYTNVIKLKSSQYSYIWICNIYDVNIIDWVCYKLMLI